MDRSHAGRWAFGLGALLAVALAAPAARPAPTPAREGTAAFQRDLRAFRTWLEIPGLAVAIVEHGRVVWHANLGYADLQHKIAVDDETRFWIASLTKTMSATLLMQLAHAGKVSLDDPMAKYVSDAGFAKDVLVSHVLSHTSEGIPGEVFAYSSGRYKLLTPVIEQASGEPLAAMLSEHIFAPLGMTETFVNMGEDARKGIAQLARPYAWTRARHNRPLPLPKAGLNAAAGVISTVRDLAKYAVALDDDTLVGSGEREQMFTPRLTPEGELLPYGLGWFAQDYAGTRLVWHYGVGRGYSSLLLKVPARGLTLIALANSEAMSAAFPLVDGDIAKSSLAVAFLRDVVRAAQDPQDAEGRTLAADAAADHALGERYLGHVAAPAE